LPEHNLEVLLSNRGRLFPAASLIARCLALCPALTELQCVATPQDLAEIRSAAGVRYPRLTKLNLTVESLTPLVDSGLLTRFPSLRELHLTVLLFDDPAQLLRLASQCPQLVRPTVLLAFSSVSVIKPASLPSAPAFDSGALLGLPFSM